MPDGDPLIWYANSDDPYHVLRISGGPLVACFTLPAFLVMCVAGARGAPLRAVLLPAALVPFAVAAAAWDD